MRVTCAPAFFYHAASEHLCRINFSIDPCEDFQAFACNHMETAHSPGEEREGRNLWLAHLEGAAQLIQELLNPNMRSAVNVIRDVMKKIGLPRWPMLEVEDNLNLFHLLRESFQLLGITGVFDLRVQRDLNFKQLTHTSPYSIHLYNTRFETFVDCPESHVFADGDKIRLVTEEVNIPIHSWYPDKLYEMAARALVFTYLVLRDTIGTGYESWKVQFQYKMGNIRKDMGTIPAVQAARKKFGRKRSAPESSSQTKKQCRLISDDVNTESLESLKGHICAMQAEVKKRTPDIKKLSDSMKKTRLARHRWINECDPTTAAIFQKYPALTLGEMLHQEFQEITNVDLDSAFLDFVNTHGKSCLHLCKGMKSAREAVVRLEAELDTLDGNEKKYRFAVGVIELLPGLIKERPHFLDGPVSNILSAEHFRGPACRHSSSVVTLPSHRSKAASWTQPSGQKIRTLDVHPSLLLGGQKPEMARTIWAAFEDFQVEALDMTGALVHLVEIYWVFNVKYSPKNQNFFALLEHFFKLKSSKALTPLVISAISSIEKLA
ncbi:uncharacterized protein LOC144146733 [Haemaphysalis longicornis]